jgi:hypothetical protein
VDRAVDGRSPPVGGSGRSGGLRVRVSGLRFGGPPCLEDLEGGCRGSRGTDDDGSACGGG